MYRAVENIGIEMISVVKFYARNEYDTLLIKNIIQRHKLGMCYLFVHEKKNCSNNGNNKKMEHPFLLKLVGISFHCSH